MVCFCLIKIEITKNVYINIVFLERLYIIDIRKFILIKDELYEKENNKR